MRFYEVFADGGVAMASKEGLAGVLTGVALELVYGNPAQVNTWPVLFF